MDGRNDESAKLETHHPVPRRVDSWLSQWHVAGHILQRPSLWLSAMLCDVQMTLEDVMSTVSRSLTTRIPKDDAPKVIIGARHSFPSLSPRCSKQQVFREFTDRALHIKMYITGTARRSWIGT